MKIKYSVFICDDEKEQVSLLQKGISNATIMLNGEEKVKFDIINSSTSYQEAADFLDNTSINSGIYFLDIEIGDEIYEKNGLDLGVLIKNKDKAAQIIFVTSHENMAFLTFKRKLGAVDFIVKNGDIADLYDNIEYTLKNAVNNIHNIHNAELNTFSYRFGHEIININFSDIIYISTTNVGHKLRLVKTTGWGEFIGKLKEIPEEYNNLVQISQSCVINPDNVEKIDLKKKSIKFINGDIEYFSVRNTRKIKDIFNKI